MKIKIELDDRTALQWLIMIHTMGVELPLTEPYEALVMEMEGVLKREILKQVPTPRLLEIGQKYGQ